MRRSVRAALLVTLVLGALGIAEPANAHPLGNFTVNTFSGIEVSTDEVVLRYVVDMAEIPTLQTLQDLGASRGSDIAPNRLADFADGLAPELLSNLTLTADGTDVDLTIDETSAALRPGQGGLDVLRVEAIFTAALTSEDVGLVYSDANYAERVGWREIVAFATGGQGIATTSVPAESVSDELRSYPEDMLSSPLDQTRATITTEPGAPPQGAATLDDGFDGVDSPGAIGGSFAGLIERDLSPAFLLVAIVLAMGFGALHALGPGHGKTVMAAYLIGTGGRGRHALTVGVAVSIMHTASVVVLGLVTLGASSLFPPEAVYPWLSFISGVVVLALGSWLLSARLRARAASRAHTHRHHEHDHVGHDHGLGYHTHGPTDLEPGTAVLSWKGLTALALSGGLLPSPTALVVLLGAVALNRVAFGVTLVAAFSVGLAAALAIVGVLVLRARAYTQRRFGGRVTSLLPILSAGCLAILGAFLTARAAIGL